MATLTTRVTFETANPLCPTPPSFTPSRWPGSGNDATRRDGAWLVDIDIVTDLDETRLVQRLRPSCVSLLPTNVGQYFRSIHLGPSRRNRTGSLARTFKLCRSCTFLNSLRCSPHTLPLRPPPSSPPPFFTLPSALQSLWPRPCESIQAETSFLFFVFKKEYLVAACSVYHLEFHSRNIRDRRGVKVQSINVR